MATALLQHLCQRISDETSQPFESFTTQPASGGCIHQSYILRGRQHQYFVKTNRASLINLFATEAESLKALAATQTLRVPNPLCFGVKDSHSYLVLEHLDLIPSRDPADAAAMGTQLAALHRQLAPDNHHGWRASNFIGATLQPNQPNTNWIDFWREQRLNWQFQLAQDQGVRFKNRDRLLDNLPHLFRDYRPVPSLLHGDLWSGNASFTADGTPVIFDPASYYGDRETDLAFTELFGSFPPAFYIAYDNAWPRHSGWQTRRELYNLYHILNHYHLFGGHYAPQAQQMIDQLVQKL
ncbi:fructosamine kinase family protein [Phragmitibacter flavus]|uniref:Fructosamine kinase family protein n=1 Tax=Phragmitibacter flavus TaxID=2576071 RepID=A0A5R8K9L8_9BACT|nr:fructosamine kinase family protein [Phragmitibacter flavus]TLD69000.1 fructosamine kinase family protein [Phragmitibacter flavus]